MLLLLWPGNKCFVRQQSKKSVQQPKGIPVTWCIFPLFFVAFFPVHRMFLRHYPKASSTCSCSSVSLLIFHQSKVVETTTAIATNKKFICIEENSCKDTMMSKQRWSMTATLAVWLDLACLVRLQHCCCSCSTCSFCYPCSCSCFCYCYCHCGCCCLVHGPESFVHGLYFYVSFSCNCDAWVGNLVEKLHNLMAAKRWKIVFK